MVMLVDRFYAWRKQLIANPRFQRWAAGLLPIRSVARQQASALFDLCAGFVYTQVLSAIVELDVISKLKAKPLSADILSPQLGLTVEATQRLLRAATAIKLLEERGQNRFGVGMLGAALAGNPGVIAMIRHHKLLYRDLSDPVALLRGARGDTGLAQFWPYAHGERDSGSEVATAYSQLMASSQSLFVDDILEAYPFHRHQILLDVGGGDGTFLTHVARAIPHLRLQLFDLPAVATQARARFEQDGFARRADVFGGDIYSGALPQGADLISLVRILHDHDDSDVTLILRQIKQALLPGGTLIIAEPMAGVKGNAPMADAYFGFYLLAMGSGRARRPDELAAMLSEAGFTAIRQHATRRPLLASLMSAQAS